MAQTLVDSRAVFLERAGRVGLPQDAIDRLVAQNVDTMAKLAFAPCQPGETPTEASLTALIKVGSTDPPLGSIAAIRHLVFEAQTILVSQTKALIENKEHEVKELAPAASSLHARLNFVPTSLGRSSTCNLRPLSSRTVIRINHVTLPQP